MADESDLMGKIVALCKRRGFIFQNSEIYGGQNGFWDYGPLGAELKRNVRDAWWREMVTMHDESDAPEHAPRAFDMVGLDSAIIMHPQVWKVSGHYDLFADEMVDCKETKKIYRVDHIRGRWAEYEGKRLFITTMEDLEASLEATVVSACRAFGIKKKYAEKITWGAGVHGGIDAVWGKSETPTTHTPEPSEQLYGVYEANDIETLVMPDATAPGTCGEPRPFNLMFETYTGAIQNEKNKAFLRPETAQGIFVNFKNVIDSSRVKVPVGICQIGKSFRNEITPRNYTFRSREFEQMECEFFCHPSESQKWYQYWRDRRFQWYLDHGLSKEKLVMREHDPDELAHYSVGTADIEYAFPFLPEGEYGELEGIAHRGDFDLRSHMEGKLMAKDGELVVEMNENGQPKYRGSGKDLTYFDDEIRERFTPHVIEPSAGADRGTLAFLCEAYHEDQAPDDKGEMQTRVVMRFHPKLAPIKAAVFPLIKKEGMPEIAREITKKLKAAGLNATYDQQGAIGRRYRRQDEIGTPYCLTVDGDTLTDNTVTLRDRDSLEQIRVPIEGIVEEIRGRVFGA